jgi:hypothetical protein
LTTRGACVGEPECPRGLRARGVSCE